MMKNINKFWMREREDILAGAAAAALVVAVVTLRYIEFL